MISHHKTIKEKLICNHKTLKPYEHCPNTKNNKHLMDYIMKPYYTNERDNPYSLSDMKTHPVVVMEPVRYNYNHYVKKCLACQYTDLEPIKRNSINDLDTKE